MLKRSILCLGLLSLPGLASAEPNPPANKPAVQPRAPVSAGTLEAAISAPRVQIALLLDTSSSMDGLIEQTKRQLWTVVNAFQNARREGQAARLEIALYEYGNDTLSAESGYIRQVVPLTTDLDRVSEHLFALKTNGGSEFCGQVIQKATQQLEWSKEKKDLKLIYIAGNEPFSQGPVSFKTAIASAKEHGIVVNTIHCGPSEVGASSGWAEGARLAGGQPFNIDQNRAVAMIAAPQDEEIAKLGVELNKTYLGYGRSGAEAKKRQAAQDENASTNAVSATTRAMSKASRLYDNSSWDLVDGTKQGKVKLEALKDEELPEELRGKNAEERKAVLDAKEKERTALQARIQQLSQERQKYLAGKEKEQAAEGNNTLDKAILQSVHTQSKEQGFTLE
ncbi:VWA domain-containing protein [Vitiosangium sp. GDMCC 1.1324]|uniref:vWA domain-containing protein n=1 Tax=Vitiosangium sp. (strain GDMCC 1.1324) TaxID=2138576 RepID=UPI000D3AB33E|nr:vWA domain-containing protein [Vitiosangium sp. GDMCC 1.1324]PTL76047.1 VWA domain-containing protein [Vitiosangium sp. GDMCC 1.1324]